MKYAFIKGCETLTFDSFCFFLRWQFWKHVQFAGLVVRVEDDAPPEQVDSAVDIVKLQCGHAQQVQRRRIGWRLSVVAIAGAITKGNRSNQSHKKSLSSTRNRIRNRAIPYRAIAIPIAISSSLMRCLVLAYDFLCDWLLRFPCCNRGVCEKNNRCYR